MPQDRPTINNILSSTAVSVDDCSRAELPEAGERRRGDSF